MALGTPTSNDQSLKSPGNTPFFDDISILLDNSYPTGGYTLLESRLQALRGDGRVIKFVGGLVGSLYEPRWDPTNKKLQLLTSNGASPASLLEVPNATNLAAVTLRLFIISV